MIELQLLSIGLAAPGLASWEQALPVLRGEAAFAPSELAPYAPQLLPPNERRRAQPAVRQAFRAAEAACAGRDASQLATVFASSDGDLSILNRICTTVLQPPCAVSPTDFHNSVHNAAAGYWGIATGARAPSTTIAGYDESFALGLLEAGLQVQAEQTPVLLVAFDVPAPEPMRGARSAALPASCALWLRPPAGDGAIDGALATLRLSVANAADSRLDDAALEAQRLANPVLRALPLLQLLARGARGRVSLPLGGGRGLVIDTL